MKRLILFVAILFSMISCLDDQSNVGENAISYLSFKSEIEEIYQSEKFLTFELDAPEVVQTTRDKELFYEWQINYKVVSTAKHLEYKCLESGLFPCRLKIYNEDGAIFKEFKLNVPFPYEEGLLLLSKYDEKSLLSFRSTDKPGEKFKIGVYALNNPRLPLGSEPKDIVYVEDNYSPNYIYIATENPVKLIKVDYRTMEVVNDIVYPEEHIDRMYGNGYSLVFFEQGRMLTMDCKLELFSNYFQQNLGREYPDVKLMDYYLIVRKVGSYRSNFLVASKSDNVLFTGESNVPTKHVIKDLTGGYIYGIVECNPNSEVISILKDKDGINRVIHIKVFENAMKSSYQAPADITSESVFLTSKKETVLYYSVGNQIFRYNYLSEGNFPEDSDYTVGETGDVIKSMMFDADEEKLYVALDAASGDYKGCVYCYDVNTKALLWHERGVAGEIVRMIYKK